MDWLRASRVIILVDDEYLVRMGIRETINWSELGFEVIGEASDGEVGLQMALKLMPDIILTDIRMPFMDGLGYMSKLRSSGSEASIIVLSGYEDFSYVRTALQQGAIDYLLKPVNKKQLVDTVVKVVQRIKEERSTHNVKVGVELDNGYSLEAERKTSFLAAAKSQSSITIDGNISESE